MSSLRTSATGVSRHRRHQTRAVSKARLVITAVVERHRPGLRCPPVRGAPGVGVQAPGPVPRRGRGGVRAPLPAAEDLTTAVTEQDVAAVLAERDRLVASGHDAGPETIRWHLDRAGTAVSRASIARILTRHGRVVPAPKKKPKSAYIRFQAEQPNESWQSDFTHVRLADGTDVEVITWLDDHSRLRPAHQRPPQDHRPHRAGHVPGLRGRARLPRLDVDRQRDGVHRAAGLPTRPRREEHLRSRAGRPRSGPEELPPEPPHHLRQGRTLPTDPQGLAAPARTPTGHPDRPAST